MQSKSTRLSGFPILILCVCSKTLTKQKHFAINNMQQWTSFVNLSQAIIKKSLKRADSDCVSFGVLDSSSPKLNSTEKAAISIINMFVHFLKNLTRNSEVNGDFKHYLGIK